MLEKGLHTVLISGLAWGIHIFLVATLLALVVFGLTSANCIRKFLLLFGLFPYFLFAFAIFSIFPFETSVFHLGVYLPQIICTVLLCSFPSFVIVTTVLANQDVRISDLLLLPGTRTLSARKTILLPLCILPGIAAARSAWPLTVLLTLLFEWARGDQSGLGATLQGIISTGDLYSRTQIVFEIVVISAVPYLALGAWRALFFERLSISSIDLFSALEPRKVDFQPLWRDGFGASRETLCWILSLAAFFVTWQLIFYFSPLDDSQKYPPVRFVEGLLTVIKDDRAGQSNTLISLFFAFLNTILTAMLGAALGTLAAAAASFAAFKSKIATHFLNFLVNFSQAVPIFVYIPLLLAIFTSRIVVELVVLVSMTFFFAYEKVSIDLVIASKNWREAVLLSGDSSNLLGAYRRARAVDFPILTASIRHSLVLVLPYAITGAVIADLFLGLKGVGSFVSYQFRGDLFITLLACMLLLVVASIFESFASRSERNMGSVKSGRMYK